MILRILQTFLPAKKITIISGIKSAKIWIFTPIKIKFTEIFSKTSKLLNCKSISREILSSSLIFNKEKREFWNVNLNQNTFFPINIKNGVQEKNKGKTFNELLYSGIKYL